MTNQEILSEIFLKIFKDKDYPLYVLNGKMTENVYCLKHADYLLSSDSKKLHMFTPAYYQMIFSHEFAKAFWGEEKETYYEEWKDSTGYLEGNGGYYQSNWQHHLQQMVLCKEPLKYLEKFL